MIYVSSGAVHFHPAPHRAYASDKMAATNLFLHLAEEFQPEQAQIIAFHPGSVLTAVGKAMGLDENSLPWDNGKTFSSSQNFNRSLIPSATIENLPADFSVWLSTKAASFLHGRFVWANWDVDELVAMKPKIQSEPGFLKMGLQGVEMVGPDLFAQIAELEKREKSMKE
jgi:NAD(P)-dependent dehydrogenase (short-subunit alcohol dehydrogenase family)